MNLSDQSINMVIDAYIDQKKTERANLNIIKDSNSLIFDMGDFYIRMYWHTDKHC